MGASQPSLKRNFIMNAILALSTAIFPLVTFPYASRTLLPSGAGKVSFAVSFISYFNLLAQLGIPTYGIRACAKVRDDKTKLTRTAHELLFISMSMAVLSYAALIAAVTLVPRLREERHLYLIVSTTVGLNAIGMEWLYKALEQYGYITARSVAFKLIAIAAMFLLVRGPGDYIVYGGITVLASSGAYVCNLFRARRLIGVRPVGGYDVRRHGKAVMVFFAMTCSTLIYTQLDTVMLGFMKSDADVGYYSAAVQVKTLLVSVTASLGNVLLPRSSYYVEQGKYDAFRELSVKALKFAIIAALPMTMYFILQAPYAIGLLAGSAYAASIPAMRIIMPTVLLIAITNIMGFQILVPMGRETVILASEIAGAVTDLALNLILIPRYAAAGAAVGTLAAEAAVLAVQYASLRNEMRAMLRKIPLRRIAAALCSGALASFFIVKILNESTLGERINGGSAWGCFLMLAVSGCVMFGIYFIVLLVTGAVAEVRTISENGKE